MNDMAVPQHHRSGAHRARRHPLLTALVTVGAVAVVSAALLWALLSLDVLGVGDEMREAGTVPPGSPATSSVEPTTTPSVPSTAAPAEASVAPGPEPSVDRSLPVDVLNATGTAGLAAGAAEVLDEEGWDVGEVGNYDGEEIPTAVLHPVGTDPATARAVVADLGVGTVTASDDVDVLTVVLGPDYDD